MITKINSIILSKKEREKENKLQLIYNKIPQISNNEVLVKTLETGICSTDRELFEQNIDFPGKDKFLILGHEAVGKIVDIGKKDTPFQKGDIVVPSVRRGCGECPFCNNERSDMCSSGKYKERGITKLHGFMSEYFIEEKINLTKIPKSFKSHAVLLEPLTVGIKALDEYFKIQEGRLGFTRKKLEKEILKNALVIGAGPIGLLSAIALACRNVNITCIDIDKEGGIKSNITKMIAGQYINIKQYMKNGRINIKELQKNKKIRKIDLIIDTSPDPAICLQLVDLLNYNSVIVHLGLPYGNKKRLTSLLDHYITTIVLKNGVIFGSVNADRINFISGLKYMKQAKKRFGNVLDKFITHRFNYKDFQKAFEIKPKNRIKVVLDWE